MDEQTGQTYVSPIKSAHTMAEGKGVYDGKRWLESLKDGRINYYKGENLGDVTKNPLTKGMADEIARIYDMQHDPEYQDILTFETEEGRRVSRSYQLPKTTQDMVERRKCSEFWARQVYGMCGRLPDFCANMVLGFYDLYPELAKLNKDLAENARNFFTYARDNDICISHALHDPCMDKSLRPKQDPDRCLRAVKERDDGIVVRGARFNTFGPFSNEILIAPTYPLAPDEEEFAIWFVVPVDAPGLSQICREIYSGRGQQDHPMSSRFDEIDTVVIFDDVFIPWERVFLYREPQAAGRLFRQGVMVWAGQCGTSLSMTRIDLLIAIGHLLAETSGVQDRQEIRMALGELCTYRHLLRASIQAAEANTRPSYSGLLRPGLSPERRGLIAMTAERFLTLVQHIATSSIIFLPNAEDFDNPDVNKYLDLYWGGRESTPEERYRLCKLAWDLVGDAYGSRQMMYDRLHSGNPMAMIEGAYRTMDMSDGLEMVREIIGMESPVAQAFPFVQEELTEG
ncbi:MAG: 4-hydroxyphenylacetate 3-hydroxylase N-terminal domain-containing protein [Rhodospirillales bacterium]|jgi:aromatic ring hydroxylase|nr:4-hydroxyphenylacetate 3-hydroxylase N-terminal domain-containing protein [Rhodospirillales bacterium]|tara:strand:- start:4829 stop:6364 length:1536 start_codon:yes stop_codon:yes gene_type:complete